MGITWTKVWAGADDGSIIKGIDLKNIQEDLADVLTTQDTTVVRLSSTTSVDMKTAASTTLYTVPADKVAYITKIVIRDTSASLAGGTDYDFTQWRQTVDLSSLTTAGTDYIVLDGNNTKYQELAATTAFQITVNTGSTAACTATVDVYGFIV